MKIRELVPTLHCTEDRLERVVYIATTIGFGDEIVKSVEYIDKNGRKGYRHLTDNGVIVATDLKVTKLVTMFIGTMDQVKAMYGSEKIPTYLYNKVRKNKKYWEKQKQILTKVNSHDIMFI